jgi:hypothetical protein
MQGYVASCVVTAVLCGFIRGDCSVMWPHVIYLQDYVLSYDLTAGLCGFMRGDCRVIWLYVR